MNKAIELAKEILSRNGNDEKKARQAFIRKLNADRKLLDVVVLFYLNHVKELGSGQLELETPIADAAPEASDGQAPLETREARAVASGTSVGHDFGETKSGVADSVPDKPIPVRAHGVKKFWRHPPKSEKEKEAARLATMLGSSAWQAYGIEKLKVREAEAFVTGEGELGAQAARASTEHVEKAAFVWQALENVKQRYGGGLADDSVTLMSLIDRADATKFWLQAKQRAPQIVADKLVPGMQRTIAEEIRQIAAA